MHHRSIMDMPPAVTVGQQSLARRTSQRNLAQRIGRRRLSEPNPREQYQDGSSLVFQSNPPSRLDGNWDEYHRPYSTIEFLDQHDVVLASDSNGNIDAVRLPRYCPPPEIEENSSVEEEQSSSSVRKFRPLGERVSKPLEVPNIRGSIKLKSLQMGHAFAVGAPSGQFHVYATEHASTWVANTSFQATSEDASRGGRVTQAEGTKQQPDRNSSFFRHVRSVLGPQRRYDRDWSSNVTSLLSMARCCHGTGHLTRDDYAKRMGLYEVDKWLSESPARTYGGNVEDKWDFHETPSAVLAAHTDADEDCFSLRVMDDRCIANGNAKKAVLCIDMTAENGTDSIERISSVCFTSDHSLATAHQTCSYHRPKAPYASSIKLWDLRMIHKDQPMSTCETHCVPSFPLDPVRCVTPRSTLDSDFIEYGSEATPVKLSSSTHSVGRLLVTKMHQGGQFFVEEEVTARILWTRKQHIHNGWPVFAVSSGHDFMACVTHADNSATVMPSGIHIYDLTQRSIVTTEFERSKKRKAHEVLEESTGKLLATIPANITDRHGMRSAVSCMAFNDTGASLVCGSEDGDMFLWRGG